jgi:hypothetical protein
MNHSKTLKMPLLSRLGKRQEGFFSENQSIRGFFGFEYSFYNCFWNLFSASGLSQICKIRNAWKLLYLCSRNTLIPCSEKTSWSLKTLFWKKNYPINSKMVNKNFLHVRLPYKSVIPMVLGYSNKKSQNMKNFHDHFLIYWTIFLPKCRF